MFAGMSNFARNVVSLAALTTKQNKALRLLQTTKNTEET